MKIKQNISLAILMIVFSLPIAAQNSITVELEEFTKLLVSGRIDVELIPSESKEMTIYSRIDRPEDVNLEVKNGELSIRIRTKINNDEGMSIKLPYKTLSKIESKAGAVINSARDLESENLELNATTGGKIELSVNSKTIVAKISQISDIILYGRTETQNVTVTTGGNYLAYDLKCKDSYIKVSSGSQAKVTASKTIDATANTKGFIGYIGDPKSATIKTSLGGEITSYKEKPGENNK